MNRNNLIVAGAAVALNSLVIDDQGRPARLITLPIPGRPAQLATLLYADGHARLVDLAQCRPAGELAGEPARSAS